MTVGELEDILARLPEDLIVTVGMLGRHHVATIETHHARTMGRLPEGRGKRCETGRCEIPRESEDVRVPPCVSIEGPRPRRQIRAWREDDPPEVEVLGRSYWRAARKEK